MTSPKVGGSNAVTRTTPKKTDSNEKIGKAVKEALEQGVDRDHVREGIGTVVIDGQKYYFELRELPKFKGARGFANPWGEKIVMVDLEGGKSVEIARQLKSGRWELHHAYYHYKDEPAVLQAFDEAKVATPPASPKDTFYPGPENVNFSGNF